MKPLLAVITGPTASGKTAASVKIARDFDTVILSADSRQFFREMNIGTAKPSTEELSAVPHYFIGHKSIYEDYDAGKFEHDALNILNDFFQEKKVVIMTGGSGMYVDAVCNGFDPLPDVEKNIREELNKIHSGEGIKKLQELLKEKDPIYFEQVDLNNPHRLIRALEICIATGKPYSDYRKKKPAERPFRILKIGLETDRDLLYQRINSRVDEMMAQGLLEEAKTLFNDRHLNALQTVGYKELFFYLEGKISLEVAVSLIKQNTRNYAKRQLTWLRKDPSVVWISNTAPEEMISRIRSEI